VIFALRRIGKPIYGFDPETWEPPARGAHRRALTQGGEQGRGGNRGDNDDSD
jgi:histone H4